MPAVQVGAAGLPWGCAFLRVGGLESHRTPLPRAAGDNGAEGGPGEGTQQVPAFCRVLHRGQDVSMAGASRPWGWCQLRAARNPAGWVALALKCPVWGQGH